MSTYHHWKWLSMFCIKALKQKIHVATGDTIICHNDNFSVTSGGKIVKLTIFWFLWGKSYKIHPEWAMYKLLYDEGYISQNINSLRPRRDRRHFADDIFKCVFLNKNEWISLRISLKFVPKVWINNIPSLVQIMAWCRPGDKPLSEPMVVNLLTHICVTRPQWVNPIPDGATQLVSYNI